MRWRALTFFSTGFLLFSLSALAAPKADLWDRWLPHDPQSTLAVDHGAWDEWLKTYVAQGKDGVNRVRYAAVTGSDRRALDAYLAGLGRTPVSKLNRSEQQAFWINLYNAMTVQVILTHYPVKSIRDIDISPGFFSDGPWGKKLMEIEGEEVSLDDIEHRILRPIWNDPRIHYAVNCASIGCPNLQTLAFTSANADELLTQGAKAYVNHPRGVQFNGKKLIVSSIYRWFASDFGQSDRAIIGHLNSHAEPPLRGQLERTNRISDHGYDWALNEVK